MLEARKRGRRWQTQSAVARAQAQHRIPAQVLAVTAIEVACSQAEDAGAQHPSHAVEHT